MRKQAVINLVRQIFKEEITPTFLLMLAESEKRLSEMQDITDKLAKAVQFNQEMYDKHISELEKSRDKAQTLASDLVKANMSLEANTTHIINALREDTGRIQEGYRTELHSAKNTIENLTEFIQHMAEAGNTSSSQGNKTEVNIGR